MMQWDKWEYGSFRHWLPKPDGTQTDYSARLKNDRLWSHLNQKQIEEGINTLKEHMVSETRFQRMENVLNQRTGNIRMVRPAPF